MITLHVPTPPSVNGMFRNVAGRGRVKSTRYLTWQRAATNEARTQRFEAIEGPVLVTMTIARPKRGRSDLDNRIKALLDFLTNIGVLADDSQVVALAARWGGDDGAWIEVQPE